MSSLQTSLSTYRPVAFDRDRMSMGQRNAKPFDKDPLWMDEIRKSSEEILNISRPTSTSSRSEKTKPETISKALALVPSEDSATSSNSILALRFLSEHAESREADRMGNAKALTVLLDFAKPSQQEEHASIGVSLFGGQEDKNYLKSKEAVAVCLKNLSLHSPNRREDVMGNGRTIEALRHLASPVFVECHRPVAACFANLSRDLNNGDISVMGNPSTISTLGRLAKSGDTHVRRSVASTLYNLSLVNQNLRSNVMGNKDTVAVLKDLVRSDDYLTKKRALGALAQLTKSQMNTSADVMGTDDILVLLHDVAKNGNEQFKEEATLSLHNLSVHGDKDLKASFEKSFTPEEITHYQGLDFKGKEKLVRKGARQRRVAHQGEGPGRLICVLESARIPFGDAPKELTKLLREE